MFDAVLASLVSLLYVALPIFGALPIFFFLCGSLKNRRNRGKDEVFICCKRCYSEDSELPASVSSSNSSLFDPPQRQPTVDRSTAVVENSPRPLVQSKEAYDRETVAVKTASTEHTQSETASVVSTPKTLLRTPQALKVTALSLNPQKLKFDSNGGLQRVFLSNCTDRRVAVKVRCSDNTLYRVNPTYSFVNPGGALTIDVLRYMGEAKPDKMIFVTADASGTEEKDAKEVFTGFSSGVICSCQPMMTVTLPLLPDNEKK